MHALTSASLSDAGTLGIERILLLVGAGATDDADIKSALLGYANSLRAPDAGGSLSLRNQRGDIPEPPRNE